MTMKTILVATPLAQMETEVLVAFATDAASSAETQVQPQIQWLSRDAALQTAVQAVTASGDFKAEANETFLIHAPQGLAAKRLLLVGTGRRSKLTISALRKAAGSAIRAARTKTIREITLAFPQLEGWDSGAMARAIGHGASVADFDPDFYRSDRKEKNLHSLTLALPEGADAKTVEAGLNEGIALGESQNLTRTLVNEPGNRMTPTILGQRAKQMCEEHGLRCQVYSTEKLHELKMGSFWGVAQGSEEPPALIVMEYTPDAAPDGPVLGLVGKGITFDSGGLSLKPADSMEKMKYDMAGAAAMIGAMRAIALLRPRVKVISVICAAENMPSGKAQKPGDVQFSMTGKSIEVLNTDAEGRLVLADGLAYAKQLGATHLIDAATLTGAVMVALGGVNAGAFCNNEDAWQHFEAALRESGEKFWRLPLDEEYRDMLRSPIADIKNVGGRYGGASIAAAFLKEFVGDTPWVHLDIAGTAWLEE